MHYMKQVLPTKGATIGIIGGGQLGRMMAFSAKKMGYNVGILDPSPNCPASQVADWHICQAYDQQAAVDDMLARCEVLTYEFENVDAGSLKKAEQLGKLPQGTKLLEITQDRELEKQFLTSHGFPVASYQIVQTETELKAALEKIGVPSVLKTTRGGYDGHGQVVLTNKEDLSKGVTLLQQGTCVLEAFIPFEKEVSIMVSRNCNGEVVTLPISENIHQHNILHESIVPARISQNLSEKIEKLGVALATSLELEGILGIELFALDEERCVINELAPRPHNSGHYSIEACDFSQFDLHVLSICNRPLPKVHLLSEVVMVNLLGQHVSHMLEKLESYPEWHIHLYGKEEEKVNRKMGHVTILTNNKQQTLETIESSDIWSLE